VATNTLTPGELQTLQWAPLDAKYGAEYGIPPDILLGQQYVESRGNPLATNEGTATLPDGQIVHTDAEGLAQFEPETWAAVGVGSPYNPADAIQAEAKYLAELKRQTGSLTGALEAYAGGAYPDYPQEVTAAATTLGQAAASTTITTPYRESTSPPPTASAASGTSFWAWLHRYAWVLIIPGIALVWLGIRKIVG
jgi:soluble lytic murein transglycosylase-like protein